MHQPGRAPVVATSVCSSYLLYWPQSTGTLAAPEAPLPPRCQQPRAQAAAAASAQPQPARARRQCRQGGSVRAGRLLVLRCRQPPRRWCGRPGRWGRCRLRLRCGLRGPRGHDPTCMHAHTPNTIQITHWTACVLDYSMRMRLGLAQPRVSKRTYLSDAVDVAPALCSV